MELPLVAFFMQLLPLLVFSVLILILVISSVNFWYQIQVPSRRKIIPVELPCKTIVELPLAQWGSAAVPWLFAFFHASAESFDIICITVSLSTLSGNFWYQIQEQIFSKAL